MSQLHFRLIAIKPLKPHGRGVTPEVIKRAKAIQKILWETNDWLYLIKGIDINEERQCVEMNKEAFLDYSVFDVSGQKVTISAIVGKNGSGKSSLIDLLIRMINNLSASLLGERFNFAAAEHLHFVDDVYGALCFQINNRVYILEERGREIELREYIRHRGTQLRYVFEKSRYILNGNDERDRDIFLRARPNGRMILERLFYSLICNYSLYGFNYRDYTGEATPEKRLNELRVKIDGLEDTIWLKGLFHKNDGYQTPVVLHPMRIDGKIDVSKENELARERLLSLIFFSDRPDHYPFRQINSHLNIVGLKIHPSTSRHYFKESETMLFSLGIGKRQNVSKNFEEVYAGILDFWDSKYHVRQGAGKALFQEACDYIVYKTLKIINNYSKYRSVFRYISRGFFDKNELSRKLTPLVTDYSHITKKLRQTIAYLTTSLYSNPDAEYSLEYLSQQFDQIMAGPLYNDDKRPVVLELLPPPIFEVDFILSSEQSQIPFNSLSSGERQLAYTISNFLYHLVNLNSAWEDYSHSIENRNLIRYRYVNVIFDEVELYFHPEMQRQFVHHLMTALRSVHLNHLIGINIIIATHSPFILSDIPVKNILCLGENTTDAGVSYGANIISILSQSFFLKSTFGEEVLSSVQKLIQLYYRSERGDNVADEYIHYSERFRYIRDNLSEPYMQGVVKDMIRTLELKAK